MEPIQCHKNDPVEMLDVRGCGHGGQSVISDLQRLNSPELRSFSRSSGGMMGSASLAHLKSVRNIQNKALVIVLRYANRGL